MPAATSIKIEFDDGSVLSAGEDTANGIWQWLQLAQTTAFIHGQDYKGPSLTLTHAKDKDEKASPSIAARNLRS